MLSKDDITPQDIPDQIHLDFYYAPNAETKKREIFFDLKFRLTGTHESISLAAMKSLHEDLAKTASLEERNDFAATNHGDLRAAKDNKKVKDWVQLHHRINLSGSDWNDEVFFELLFTKTNTEEAVNLAAIRDLRQPSAQLLDYLAEQKKIEPEYKIGSRERE